jgi:catechol 2,3-dioxygenase-like lactoylglutathione lyase family enzyme
VAETARSCHFYDALLGLKLGGDGVNSGPSQDGLDGLQETRVRITSHRCSTGAGVECLNYLPPNQGRLKPDDQGAQDLGHWQIRLEVSDLEPIATGSDVIELGEQANIVGAQRALQLADPDGHRLQLLQA